MTRDKTVLGGWSLFALWFGAAISLAEILTGSFLAPLGFIQGVWAIVIGHLIGGAILILGGMIGFNAKIGAMTSTRIAFGRYGSYLFSVLNMLQLLGWTAVMMLSGAKAADALSFSLWGIENLHVWTIVIAALILLWIALGKQGFTRLNVIAVVLLLGLTLLLCFVVFREQEIFSLPSTGEMSFGAALELCVIMPLSWLPLIADYTRFAAHKTRGLIGSFLGYFLGSSLMYTIGLAMALYAQDASVASMMNALNLGFFALGIVLLSTVTTTFLDAYSAGVTFRNLFPQFSERSIALVMTLIGLGVALLTPIEAYESFLYAIGSVFAPLFAIVLSDYFLFGNTRIDETLRLHVGYVFIWIAGIIVYYYFLTLDFILGSTLPTMIVTLLLFVTLRKGVRTWTLKNN
ncbi:putative hydroxymethylpyrimidine transporter CytX [Sulfurospirillum sp. hDNRA2]|uniref:putative hydroxymethylpyrimidine transporter CytX n=1 Tax=Sulfurospirillum sp. hDNRA2 TaxID=3237298 RepID=UPI0020B7C98D|nr:putative hydroxymethylpyrimidine transporter CytX [Sulfurospirillum sp. DNRA8]MCP3651360.1 putative hydroxymethylpyrimidine transporter CytX [Sulfurospirillum sp. DNRA8]MCR1810207.1 putative hydroxymethylpyrimidine transporter CytX [Sulfurospirillum sp. DNRA8]